MEKSHLRSYNLEITCQHFAHLGVLTFVFKHGVIFCLCVSFFFFNIYFLFYLAVSGLSCGTQDFHCFKWDLLLHHTDSQLAVCKLSTCFVTCEILVPYPGIEPVSPALQGGFITTGPPGKSLCFIFMC